MKDRLTEFGLNVGETLDEPWEGIDTVTQRKVRVLTKPSVAYSKDSLEGKGHVVTDELQPNGKWVRMGMTEDVIW